MRKVVKPWLIAILVIALFVIAQPLLAQDNVVTDDEVNEVARDIYCPVCESTPLDVCATQACADWRELIRTKLGEGDSKEEIFEYFARQYGDGVLANPPRRGISLIILWVLPIVLLLIGVLLFSRILRNLRSEPTVAAAGAVSMPTTEVENPPASSPEPAAKDDYLARVEEELGKK